MTIGLIRLAFITLLVWLIKVYQSYLKTCSDRPGNEIRVLVLRLLV